MSGIQQKNYSLEYSNAFKKQLKKLDPAISCRIMTWLDENIEQSNNPRHTGKSLKGEWSGYWRYRIGNYRVIVRIKDKECIILAVQVGHRKHIYS